MFTKTTIATIVLLGTLATTANADCPSAADYYTNKENSASNIFGFNMNMRLPTWDASYIAKDQGSMVYKFAPTGYTVEDE